MLRVDSFLAQQIELSHHLESDNCEVMIKRVGETYSCTFHDDKASCVDSGQFVEVGAPEIFPRPLQIASLARKDFESARAVYCDQIAMRELTDPQNAEL
jgi:hypothetical protein